jgi:hypothetical protein|nr:MAG TPA: Ribbon-helix-helix protein, copG family [Caudoviricetes sp.]
MGRNIENKNNWYKNKYEKFGADLDKEYCQKLKKAIKEDKNFTSIADWIRKYGDEYLKK